MENLVQYFTVDQEKFGRKVCIIRLTTYVIRAYSIFKHRLTCVCV